MKKTKRELLVLAAATTVALSMGVTVQAKGDEKVLNFGCQMYTDGCVNSANDENGGWNHNHKSGVIPVIMHLRIILLFYRSVSVHPESHKPFHMLQQLSPHDIPAVQIPNLLQTGYMLFFPVVLFFSMFHCQM